MQKIKCNDEVIILTGNDKGKLGKVTKILKAKTVLRGKNRKRAPNGTAEGKIQRVVVEGINLVKKTVKADPNSGQTGGFVEVERPIHVSNVALFNASTKKKDKVAIQENEDGARVRVFKSTNEAIDS